MSTKFKPVYKKLTRGIHRTKATGRYRVQSASLKRYNRAKEADARKRARDAGKVPT